MNRPVYADRRGIWSWGSGPFPTRYEMTCGCGGEWKITENGVITHFLQVWYEHGCYHIGYNVPGEPPTLITVRRIADARREWARVRRLFPVAKSG